MAEDERNGFPGEEPGEGETPAGGGERPLGPGGGAEGTPGPARIGNTEELWAGRGRRPAAPRSDERPREPVQREIVLPGEVVERGRGRAGPGTYRDGEAILASCLGIKNFRDGTVSVIPLAGKYIPKMGDFVVGKVVEMTPSAWVVDLNSPYVAPLPASETPWDVGFGEAGKYLTIGDTLLLEILRVDDLKKVTVSMNGPTLRKLVGGQTMDVDATKVPRLIGRGGSMIGLLKRLTRCRIIVGQNGRVWLDGTVDDLNIAMAAVLFIEREAHRMGLTDAVAALIEDMRQDLERKRSDREGRRDFEEQKAIVIQRNVKMLEEEE